MTLHFSRSVNLWSVIVFSSLFASLTDAGCQFYKRGLVEVPARGLWADCTSSTLHLETNNIDVIRAGTFAGFSTAGGIYLYSNVITTLEADSFANTTVPPSWPVDLRFNSVAVIESGAWDGASIGQLRLQTNELRDISSGAFSGGTFEDVFLCPNPLSTIQRGAFAGTTIKGRLALSGCAPSSLSGAFYGLKADTIHLNNNLLTSIPEDLFHMPSLSTLAIRSNLFHTNPFFDANAALSLFQRLDVVSHDCLVQWHWESCDGAVGLELRQLRAELVQEATHDGVHCNDIAHIMTLTCRELAALRPSPSPSPSPTVSHTPSATPTISHTASITPTHSHTPSTTPTSQPPTPSPHFNIIFLAVGAVGLALSLSLGGILIWRSHEYRKRLQVDREQRYNAAKQGMEQWTVHPQYSLRTTAVRVMPGEAKQNDAVLSGGPRGPTESDPTNTQLNPCFSSL